MLSHNAAFHCVEGRLVMYGGRSREKFGVYLSQKHERGIMRWEAIRSPTTKSRWTWLKHSKRLVVRGNHTGCIERRKTIYPMCEFDGRLSVVAANDGSELLYARANTKSKGGGRSVQVARSSDGGRSWGAFELIRFEGAEALNISTTRSRGRDRGKKLLEYNGWHLPMSVDGTRRGDYWLAEIYVFVVHTSPPSAARPLTAIFPATFAPRALHDTAKSIYSNVSGILQGGVFVSESHDGVVWTMPSMLLRSEAVLCWDKTVRTTDHPAGLWRDANGGVHLQLEIDVDLWHDQFTSRRDALVAYNVTKPHQCTYPLEEAVKGGGSSFEEAVKAWELRFIDSDS